ncbi:HNH endonuclease family protein [Pseudonocardia sp. H11422]|uniref:HNH endonuclease family protein n=1 Tax=Pseudonocardia sp. H11422 TaxID=2835866 RepID=UPI0027E23724|nr:HNH endonuclease family protein [Pseudonocardia sp. H11422]
MGAVAVLVAAAGIGGCSVDGSATQTTMPITVTSWFPGEGQQVLASLPVKGRAPKTGYDRDEFGQRWADIDRNGCDQRNDVLARDLANVTFKPGTDECVVMSGTLVDPYSGKVIEFARGEQTSTAVQIDHVVALSDAWQKGAQQLDAATRERLANDPDNLLAVDGPTNAAKGDGDAATWLPPRREFWCTYAGRQVEIKARYRLWVTAAERDALARALDGCPAASSPAGSLALLDDQEIGS